MLGFWRELVRWQLGTDFNLVTDAIADPEEEGWNRRGFTICRGNKVVMMAFISQSSDVDAEDILVDSAASCIGFTSGAKIYVLFCQGVECEFLSVQSNGAAINVVQEAEVLGTENDESIKIIREWLECGVNDGIVPPDPENWSWFHVYERFWNNELRRWAPRNGQEEVFPRRW